MMQETFGFNIDDMESVAAEPDGLESGGKGSKMTNYEIAPYGRSGQQYFSTNVAVDGQNTVNK